MNFNFKNVTLDTWARLLILVLAMIAAIFQMNKTGADFSTVATSILTTITALWGFWKNNSFTENAQMAQDALEELNRELRKDDFNG